LNTGRHDPQLLIVGIGNPGPKYQQTRHNAGFWVVDFIVDSLKLKLKRSHKSTILAEGSLGGKNIVVAKPRTYVNLSGESAGYLLSRYSLPTQKLLVIYDDIHINAGKMRLRGSGSAGGHNGIRSIINSLNTQDFPRLRIGVGSPNIGEDQIGYVLGKPTMSEREAIVKCVADAMDCVETLLTENIDVAMDRFN
jgi:PTH1 family peptidyl-tRNA hydrolase|tara:strand:- start:6251 stop:6832 length:582 start_codon:yes stop_codon:yes gene_type:complete